MIRATLAIYGTFVQRRKGEYPEQDEYWKYLLAATDLVLETPRLEPP